MRRRRKVRMMRRLGTMTRDPSLMSKMPRRLNLIKKSLSMGSRYPSYSHEDDQAWRQQMLGRFNYMEGRIDPIDDYLQTL